MSKSIINKNKAKASLKKTEVLIKSKEKKGNEGSFNELSKGEKNKKNTLKIKNKEPLLKRSKPNNSIAQTTNLFDHAPVAYFILDINGIIINSNKKGVSLLGVSRTDLLGKNLVNFINSKTSKELFQVHKHLVIEKQTS
jgi:PAS domain-containing protein